MTTPTRPPTEYVHPAPPPRLSRWPTALGIIALLLASLNGLGGCWNLLMVALAERLGGDTPQHDVWTQYSGTMTVMAVLSLLLGAALLVGGVGLLKRRRWCRRLLLGWAVVQVLVTVISMSLNWSAMRDQLEAAQAQPGIPAGVTEAIAFGSITLSLLLTIVPPVFALVWFNRGKIRAEMKNWPR